MKQTKQLTKLNLNKQNIINLTHENKKALRGGMAISGKRSECCANPTSYWPGCDNVDL